MPKPPRKPSMPAADVVPHPRFGDRSVPAGNAVPLMDVMHWFDRYGIRIRMELVFFPGSAACGYRMTEATFFPGSAIPADVSRQHYSVAPRDCHVDLLRPCRACGRPFIFFAREQQYWYEDLGFWIDADCVHCVECRRKDHQLRQRFQRYSERIGRHDLSDTEFASLIEDAVFLFHEGVLKNEQRLRTLKNQAVARLPGEPATEAILGVVLEIQRRHEAESGLRTD